MIWKEEMKSLQFKTHLQVAQEKQRTDCQIQDLYLNLKIIQGTTPTAYFMDSRKVGPYQDMLSSSE